MAELIEELAYVTVGATDLGAWSRYATQILGAEVVDLGPGELRVKIDERAYRYIVGVDAADRVAALGWRTRDRAGLDELAGRVAALGFAVEQFDGAAATARQVDAGIRFRCRNGITHEVVCGAARGREFAARGDVTGYVTGSDGLGHVVWTVPDVPAMDDLMLGAFGMSLREDIPTPVGRGHFYGCNPRHHSLAVLPGEELRFEHVMAEMLELDDVGRCLDRAEDLGYRIRQPLGRHRTDHMVSFYIETPGRFGMEIGWGGVKCGADWAEIRDSNRRRPWGHGDAMRSHRAAAGNGHA
ncbi:VOC family protein [Amycolatopsis ultiminotia]|uniref:VOC family protein n=1 Tax=Amycolatopsis ultiminotia TaxID=543629 RepID=A0ABP6YHV5_9PSEU